jgi:hypothetical protein
MQIAAKHVFTLKMPEMIAWYIFTKLYVKDAQVKPLWKLKEEPYVK